MKIICQHECGNMVFTPYWNCLQRAISLAQTIRSTPPRPLSGIPSQILPVLLPTLLLRVVGVSLYHACGYRKKRVFDCRCHEETSGLTSRRSFGSILLVRAVKSIITSLFIAKTNP